MSLGARVSYLDWSHVRGWVEHNWITTIWRHYSHWRYKALKGITPPWPKGVSCRSTLLKGAAIWKLSLQKLIQSCITPFNSSPCESKIVNFKVIFTQMYSIPYTNIFSIQVHLKGKFV
jgi:hypothetical protein